jgi:hypothetical protein
MLGDVFSFFNNGEPQGIPRSIKDGVNALRFATQRAVGACLLLRGCGVGWGGTGRSLIYTEARLDGVDRYPNRSVDRPINPPSSLPVLPFQTAQLNPRRPPQLRDRRSRMEVNLPRGVPLGVEAPNLDKDGDKYVKADRELARLVVELFKPIIDATVVVFPQQWQARKAADIWGTALVKTSSFEAMGAAPAVGSAGKRGGKKKKGGGFGSAAGGGGGGGGAGVGASAIPPGTEVLIVVAPSPKELQVVRRISDELGMDTLIIVLNTPLALAANYMPKDDAAALLQAFEPVLFLNPLNDPSVKTLDNMLLFRSYPGPWQIAQKGALGPPTVLAEKDGRFEKEETLAALRKGAENNAKPAMEKIMQGFFGGGK